MSPGARHRRDDIVRYGTGVALVAGAGVLWSMMGLAVKSIEAADTWQVLFWRSVGTLPLLLGMIWLRNGALLAPLRRAGPTGIAGGVGLVFAFVGSIYAMQTTTVANAVFLFSSAPFIAAVLGRLLLGERVRPSTWVLMAVAMSGMYLMVSDSLSAGMGIGSAAAFMSAAGFAVFTLALRHGRLTDMLPATLIGALMSMAIAAGVTVAKGGTLTVSLHDLAIGLGMGAVSLGLGMVLYTFGSRVLRAADATLMSNLEVLLAPVWVWLFLGETATQATLMGGAVLLVAVTANALIGLRPAHR
jgi:drug/metabolite transporter (DMT)-like permease